MANKKTQALTLPLIPVRGMTVFPGMVTHFDVGREKSTNALEYSMGSDQLVMLASQKNNEVFLPTKDDILEIGTVVKVKQMLKMPGELIRVLVEGVSRARILDFVKETPFFLVKTSLVNQEGKIDTTKFEALKRLTLKSYENYLALTGRGTVDAINSILEIENPSKFTDLIISNMQLKLNQKQELLECFDVVKRLEKVFHLLEDEIKILAVERDLSEKVKDQISQNQKEYYLREQLKIIKNELGDDVDEEEEVEEFRAKLKELNFQEDIKKKLEAEIDRYLFLSSSSPELYGIRNYLKLVFELPWNKLTEDTEDIIKSRKILDEDHYGLDDVKTRIIEHLAVRILTKSNKGSIICLVGPPGVGKTSIAKSIARSMNREFTRMSLGGVKDESEIRGHRRTYIGSMPGRIITAINEAKSKNPVFLFDEIDKLSNDFRGDPASALLEVLDPAQNHSFVDRYLEIPFDLSGVMFISTANRISTIPRALYDRMEIIELSSYTSLEKLQIAKKYLVKKQMKEHGLTTRSFSVTDRTLETIISSYTRESGVRTLERTIGKLCRKAAVKIIEKTKKKVSVGIKNLSDFLGAPLRIDDTLPSTDTIGLVTGLAWTSIGGETLPIEVSVLKGNGKLQLTGSLGNTMKESAHAGISYIRSRAIELGIDPAFHKKYDIHIHLPEGAVPKDGPSAGISMALALASALSGIPIKRDVALTGEITLRGRVLQIGGLKEKTLAAARYGIKTVIIPETNEKDLEKIPEEVKKSLKFVLVKDMDKVIETAFSRKPKKLTASEIKKLEKENKDNRENAEKDEN